MSYDHLKARQRAERHEHAGGIALRIHRALSWLKRSEMCDDEDGRFIFLWIAFNSAYANDLGEQRVAESRLLRDFLSRLSDLDCGKRLYGLVWRQYSESIRVLLNNQYVFQPYWDCQHRLEGSEEWKESFAAARRAAHAAIAEQETGTVLAIVFQRLYTLRNQLVHGGATWGSSINREQLRDANRIMGDLVPAVIEIMLDNAHEHWGDACYPVH